MLPETLGAILPETIEDGENFGKDQCFWDFPRCQRQKEIEPDTVTASSGDSLPVVAAIDLNLIRAPSDRANALRTSIRGEAFRSSLLTRQRQQRQLDPNDKSHKTNNPETIISSSSAPPPRPPID
ncbi:carcinine transporter-like [Daphnia pulicaria]|uniref:carcinine transporter-like n=1 Tax=Daphnia pulicaria TaxID=35523 RepID=UPI001EEC8299|nr:carcinine transporter-like [Daphnia pulicaria]